MAITTYTNLQASIADWLNRDDLSAVIPDFISLCEADLNQKLRVRQMSQRSTGPASGQFMTLPSDFLEARNFQLNTNPLTVLQYRSPEALDEIRKSRGESTGTPEYYTFVGDTIELIPAPDTEYTMELTYYQSIPALSVTETNWLLDLFPSIYLYGSLVHSATYLNHDDRLPTWAAMYASEIQALQTSNENAVYSGNTIRMGMTPFRTY